MVLVIENSSITLFSLNNYFARRGYVLQMGDDINTYNIRRITDPDQKETTNHDEEATA